MNNIEDWTASELFNYLISMSVIHSDEEFEDWKHDRPEMIRMVREDMEQNSITVSLVDSQK